MEQPTVKQIPTLDPTYPIATARLHLRPFRDEDLADVHAFYSLPEVARFVYWEPRSLAETEKVLTQKQGQTRLTEAGTNLTLGVALQKTNRIIGEVTLMWRSQEHQQGEVGFVFNPAFQGQGYATEAALAMLALGFDELQLHRIYGRCDALNVPSYKLMERLGMRREAHFIHNEIFKGEWSDELVYAMLQSEWRGRET